MTTAVKAVYENGVFRPKEPVELQEKTEVEVLIPAPASVDNDDPTGWKTADELIGFIKDGPQGAIGRDHDEYLYRKSPAQRPGRDHAPDHLRDHHAHPLRQRGEQTGR